MNLKTTLIAAAFAITAPFAASAATITPDSSTIGTGVGELAQIVIGDDNTGTLYTAVYIPTGSSGELGTNPASLSLTSGNAFSVNLDLINNDDTGFSVAQVYSNDTGGNTLFETETINPGILATNFVYEVNSIVGGSATTTNLLTTSTFAADVGTNFTITVSATDVTSAFDFDYRVEAVPVPAGILLMGTAVAGFGVMRRRRKKA